MVGKGGLPPLLFCQSMLTFAKQSGGKPPLPTASLNMTFSSITITKVVCGSLCPGDLVAASRADARRPELRVNAAFLCPKSFNG